MGFLNLFGIASESHVSSETTSKQPNVSDDTNARNQYKKLYEINCPKIKKLAKLYSYWYDCTYDYTYDYKDKVKTMEEFNRIFISIINDMNASIAEKYTTGEIYELIRFTEILNDYNTTSNSTRHCYCYTMNGSTNISHNYKNKKYILLMPDKLCDTVKKIITTNTTVQPLFWRFIKILVNHTSFDFYFYFSKETQKEYITFLFEIINTENPIEKNKFCALVNLMIRLYNIREIIQDRFKPGELLESVIEKIKTYAIEDTEFEGMFLLQIFKLDINKLIDEPREPNTEIHKMRHIMKRISPSS